MHSLMHQAVIEQELGNLVRQTDNKLAKALQSIAKEERQLLEDKINKLRSI